MSTQASRRDVIRIRLVRQGLFDGRLRGVTEVTDRLLALQAQDYAAAKWALGVRAPGTTLADVDAAINSGRIVRSWPMRGTLHFVPAADLCCIQPRQQVLVLLDEWVRSPRRLDRDEALGEFVLRYFDGHGPATLRDFAWWSQLTVADARAGLAVAADRLAELVVDGVTYYLAAAADTGDADAAKGHPTQRSPLLALPAFDEYLIGYQDRSFAIDDGSLGRVVPGGNGMFLPLILASGRVIGTWRQTKTARSVSLEPRPFDPLSAGQAREFERAVAQYAHFLGLSVGGNPTAAPATAPAEPEPPLA